MNLNLSSSLLLILLSLLIGATKAFLLVSTKRGDLYKNNKCLMESLLATKEATFGMGCFWKPSEELLKVPGVKDTIVGYTGNPSFERSNNSKAPTYESVCLDRNWVEGVRVIYDEDVISYNELLDAFFEAQEPKYGYRQYASIIFPHDAKQKDAAQEWMFNNGARIRSDGVSTAMTQIEDKSPFFRAEKYHQRYWQKTRPRVATMVALMALGSGIVDDWTPLAMHSPVHTGANALVLAGLLYVLAERKIDTNVVQLDT
jgi:methionine-S-sulfoxide reductase